MQDYKTAFDSCTKEMQTERLYILQGQLGKWYMPYFPTFTYAHTNHFLFVHPDQKEVIVIILFSVEWVSLAVTGSLHFVLERAGKISLPVALPKQ